MKVGTIPYKDYQLYNLIVENNLRCPADGTMYGPKKNEVNWKEIERCYGVTLQQLSEIEERIEAGKHVRDQDRRTIEALRKNKMKCPKVKNTPGQGRQMRIDWKSLEKCYDRSRVELYRIQDNGDFGVRLSEMDDAIYKALWKYNMQCPPGEREIKHD